jgi:Mrp family chromosome partitioning ATPase
LLEQATLDEVLCPVPRVPNLTLLGTGSEYRDPAKLTTSDAMAELVRQLRLRFDFVLIDTPPVVPFADGRAMAALVDGVVLVGRAGTTTRAALVQAMQLLQAAHSAPIMDIVLNAAEFPTVDYRYYRYGTKGKRNGSAA